MVYAKAAYTMGRADRATCAAMGSRYIMKLRHMSAEVLELSDVVIEEERFGEVRLTYVPYALALKSYESIVAIYYDGEIYMLPRYDYSITTWEHVHAFIQDCTSITDLCARDMRKALRDGSFGYHLAAGYDVNMQPCYDDDNELHFISTITNRPVVFRSWKY